MNTEIAMYLFQGNVWQFWGNAINEDDADSEGRKMRRDGYGFKTITYTGFGAKGTAVEYVYN